MACSWFGWQAPPILHPRSLCWEEQLQSVKKDLQARAKISLSLLRFIPAPDLLSLSGTAGRSRAFGARPAVNAVAAPPASAISPDSFLLDLAEKLEESASSYSQQSSTIDAISKLREHSAERAVASRWPTNKTEAYRFTDLRFLQKADITPASPAGAQEPKIDSIMLHPLEDNSLRLVFVDGMVSNSLSSLSKVPNGAFVGSIFSLQQDNPFKDRVLSKLGGSELNVFGYLNGLGVQDIGVIYVPEGVEIKDPVHVLCYTLQGGDVDEIGQSYVMCNPRLLVVVEKGAKVNIVEEFVAASISQYWSNAVLEMWIAEGGHVDHSYLQNQARQAVTTKQTCVAQSESSSYKLVEVGVGGRLSRHDLRIEQLGPDTVTEMSSFLLSGQNQLQDLHSRLVLNHPRGIGRQLHKCIVMHSSGHSVFDGNVMVNRYAQQTDAGQLSRSLLLAPRATVNIKPNLQIIADDVKCSHGAAVSDLEDDQLFYFRARGIDLQTARSLLIFSFGAEVLSRLEGKELRKRVESLVKGFLAAEGAIQA